jgi:hypothetical protein
MSCPRAQTFSVVSLFVIALTVVFLHPALSAQDSSSSSTRSKPSIAKPRRAESSIARGTVSAGVYRNPSLGFSCKIPPGWVLRTEEMNAGDSQSESITSDSTLKGADKTARVLLAAFSRPPEARAEDINSSILIAAESMSTYPGLKDAAQYFGPLTEVANVQGFEADEEPYEVSLGTKTLVRGDFHKDVGTRVMRQSTLVLLAHAYAVSFTFIGGTEDEVEELIGNLSFAAAAKTAH